ncbi:hypothetical protein [Nonomuraea sp. SBT364]|uniref:hypothetical protein n=1 Tax=Nonomuraea sp. SBT364 TaxID=1580530 RepID=UPI00066E658F|nr:hypothetical protein [Nonomuraea sp. SBT364]
MWIAVGVALAVAGVIVWSFRRGASGADEAPEPGWDWESRLEENARVAFMEGLRACHDRAVVSEERGVLRLFEPPRVISLPLLADRFAARGQDGLHDPEGVVRELVEWCAATERPGVLHLSEGLPAGEADGMDGAAFGAAVRELVRPGSPAGGSWYLDEAGGCLEVVVPGEYATTLLLDLGRVHERYRAARGERAGMPAGAVLRDVVFGLIAADGPGLTWTRPPSERHRTAVLAAGRTAPEHRTAG